MQNITNMISVIVNLEDRISSKVVHYEDGFR